MPRQVCAGEPTSDAGTSFTWPSQGAIKNHISAHRQNFNKLVGNFFGINIENLYAKFQLAFFKTEEGV